MLNKKFPVDQLAVGFLNLLNCNYCNGFNCLQFVLSIILYNLALILFNITFTLHFKLCLCLNSYCSLNVCITRTRLTSFILSAYYMECMPLKYVNLMQHRCWWPCPRDALYNYSMASPWPDCGPPPCCVRAGQYPWVRWLVSFAQLSES